LAAGGVDQTARIAPPWEKVQRRALKAGKRAGRAEPDRNNIYIFDIDIVTKYVL